MIQTMTDSELNSVVAEYIKATLDCANATEHREVLHNMATGHISAREAFDSWELHREEYRSEVWRAIQRTTQKHLEI